MINNEFYNDLGERWYTATDDPVALLRAECRLRNPWVLSEIKKHHPTEKLDVLDVACGAGFLSNPLAREGHRVTGIDLSESSLVVAGKYDTTGTAKYLVMDAYELSFPDASFDVVCAMDFLEHVDDPGRVVKEISRVLKPGGRFFFHTLNRTFLCWLFGIKGVEWVVKNTPKDMHVSHLLITPAELAGFCEKNGLQIKEIRGVMPRVFSRAFLNLLLTGHVSEEFEFRYVRSKALTYSGMAQKQ
jgi:2-polyprenyl-6-hydroxyphenyl methylase/3-demethylubiquinone-9 3-methyltransferase